VIIIKGFAVLLMVGMFLVISNGTVNAKTETINEADTELCETVKMALISSNTEPVDKAIAEIHKNDKNAPEGGLSWAPWETEILRIKQVYGIGGLYEITLKVFPYQGAHNGYGEDEVVINTRGELISYKQLKPYHY
jgi:hypothetical protein